MKAASAPNVMSSSGFFAKSAGPNADGSKTAPKLPSRAIVPLVKLAPPRPAGAVAAGPHAHVVLVAVQLRATHASASKAWRALSHSRQLGAATVLHASCVRYSYSHAPGASLR